MSDPISASHDAYRTWLEAARPQLDQHAWSAAFANEECPYPYTRLRLDPVPLVPLNRPLSQTRIVLVDSAGVHCDDQPRFHAEDIEGDASYRLLPTTTPYADLRIAHDHYDHAAAEQDLNSVYPIERLEDLARAGVIAAPAPTALSFSGYITDAEIVVEQLAPDLLRQARGLGADAALFVPV